MMKKNILLFIGLMCFSIQAQTIANLNFRNVPADQMKSFMQNEAIYWSKVAAVLKEKGQINGWSICVRVGGGLASEPNVYSRIAVNSWDKMESLGANYAAAEAQVQAEMDPEKWALIEDDLKMDKYSMANLIMQSGESTWAKDGKWKYLVHNYAKVKNAGEYIAEEVRIMKPFFTSLMKKGKTKMKGWATAIVLSPRGYAYPYNAQTIDFYENFEDIFNPFNGAVEWPEEIAKLNGANPNGFWKSMIWYNAMYLDKNNQLVMQ
jgi:hypothetical protein